MKIPLNHLKIWPARSLVLVSVTALLFLANPITANKGNMAVPEDRRASIILATPTKTLIRFNTPIPKPTATGCQNDLNCLLQTATSYAARLTQTAAIKTSMQETINAAISQTNEVHTQTAATKTSMQETINAAISQTNESLTLTAIPTILLTDVPTIAPTPADTPTIAPTKTPSPIPPEVMVAIVGCSGSVVVALITGWFTILAKRSPKKQEDQRKNPANNSGNHTEE